MTIIAKIPNPFGRRIGSKWYNRSPLITIWHVDPQKDGTDDSCDWFGTKKTKNNGWYPASINEYNKMSSDVKQAIDFIWYKWHHKLGRPWYKHPKYHFWHWDIQIEPINKIRRWIKFFDLEMREQFSYIEAIKCGSLHYCTVYDISKEIKAVDELIAIVEQRREKILMPLSGAQMAWNELLNEDQKERET